MTDPEAPQKDEKGRFLPGNSGFGGRPKGARNKLGEAFIQALHDSFLEHGPETIETVRTEKPDQYLKVIASLMPKDVNLNVTNDTEELTDDELRDRIRSLTQSLAPFLDGAGAAEGDTGAKGSSTKPARVH